MPNESEVAPDLVDELKRRLLISIYQPITTEADDGVRRSGVRLVGQEE
jgi:hypothetical protein